MIELFNRIQIPLQWYSILLLVIPSLLAALIINPKTCAERDQCKSKRKEREKKKIQLRIYKKKLAGLDGKERQCVENEIVRLKKKLHSGTTLNDLIYFLWQIIAVVLAYVVITAVAIFIYSSIRYYTLSLKNTDITIWSIWKGFACAYISLHWKEAILIPCLTAVVAKGLKNTSLKAVLCIILSAVLLVSSLLTTTGASKVLPMEDEILTELKCNPTFDYSISDIEGFQDRVHAGYLKEEKTAKSGGNDSSGEQDQRPAELDMDINSLSIEQLMKCIWYLADNDTNLLNTYVDRAYVLYSAGVNASQFDAAIILFYYARCHNNASYFLRAARQFENAESYWNAVLSLREYCWSEKGAFMDLTGRIIDDSVLAIERRQNDSPMTYCEEIMEFWYGMDESEWPINDFDRLCVAAPDEAFLNIINANMQIKQGKRRDKDKSRIQHILKMKQYKNCPKALLLSQYYGGEHLNKLYQLYTNHPDWFETEDKLNLAWLFYERGEYQVALSITDGGTEDVLIRTEAFLQSPDEETNLDELYVDVTKAIKEGAGDNEARLRLAQILIGNRLGLETSYVGLSEICEEVFDTNSTTGLFIISSLKSADGQYEEAYVMTKAIMKKLDAPDPLYYRTLFLQADTLIGMASMPEYAGEATKYYENAASILESIRDSVEGDYVECLKRLVNVYKALNRDPEMNRTRELLAKIEGDVED